MAELQAPAIHTNPTTLIKHNIAVTVDANPSLVAIQIGNTTLRLHYEDALQISQWIRVRAKEAKDLCGDKSRHWSAIANLRALED